MRSAPSVIFFIFYWFVIIGNISTETFHISIEATESYRTIGCYFTIVRPFWHNHNIRFRKHLHCPACCDKSLGIVEIESIESLITKAYRIVFHKHRKLFI